MSLETTDNVARYDRNGAVEFLGKRGYRCSATSLATYITRGGGPVYHKWGHRVFYTAADLLAWAEGRTSAPRRSSSEADASRAAA